MADIPELTEEEKKMLKEGCHSSGPKISQPNRHSSIKHVIGVVSGKGGVGKSLVTSLLAAEANRRGKKVAILDADVTGPSIPRTFGIKPPLKGDEEGIFPAETKSGIKLISTNLMLPQDDMPVAWRGPVVSNIIKQFFEETHWGDIDYMFVDMPPGTSDVLLTVFQNLPIEGIITVSAPQELVAMIVGKAVHLANQMEVEILGLVENMAYFECPDCGSRHYIYGEPQGESIAKRYQIPAYATLPIDPEFARLCDVGKVEEYDVAGALDPVIENIVAAVEKNGE
ncbi:MAG: P-loop NTPase [Eggerthellaceae bacterium]|nr:P-loop NTPase [Eggerthellaceae bacterium]